MPSSRSGRRTLVEEPTLRQEKEPPKKRTQPTEAAEMELDQDMNRPRNRTSASREAAPTVTEISISQGRDREPDFEVITIDDEEVATDYSVVILEPSPRRTRGSIARELEVQRQLEAASREGTRRSARIRERSLGLTPSGQKKESTPFKRTPGKRTPQSTPRSRPRAQRKKRPAMEVLEEEEEPEVVQHNLVERLEEHAQEEAEGEDMGQLQGACQGEQDSRDKDRIPGEEAQEAVELMDVEQDPTEGHEETVPLSQQSGWMEGSERHEEREESAGLESQQSGWVERDPLRERDLAAEEGVLDVSGPVMFRRGLFRAGADLDTQRRREREETPTEDTDPLDSPSPSPASATSISQLRCLAKKKSKENRALRGEIQRLKEETAELAMEKYDLEQELTATREKAEDEVAELREELLKRENMVRELRDALKQERRKSGRSRDDKTVLEHILDVKKELRILTNVVQAKE